MDNLDTFNKSICILKDGSIMLAGNINDYGAQTSKCFPARLKMKELTSVEDVLAEAEDAVSIYPNPCADYVEINIAEHANYLAELIDLSGRRLIALESVAGNRIDLSNLPAGKYFLRLEADGKKYIKKLIKE